MKIWIHRTYYHQSLNDIKKKYPVFDNYKLDEKQNEHGDPKLYIHINSLKQLVELSRDLHHPLIINAEGDEPTIEIYDDWRE